MTIFLALLLFLTFISLQLSQKPNCPLTTSFLDLEQTQQLHPSNQTSFLIYTVLTGGGGFDYVRLISNKDRYSDAHPNVNFKLTSYLDINVTSRVWQKVCHLKFS